jgi:hypothetical protein
MILVNEVFYPQIPQKGILVCRFRSGDVGKAVAPCQ